MSRKRRSTKKQKENNKEYQLLKENNKDYQLSENNKDFQLSENFNNHSIELKRYKNRIAAKKSRDKKNEYLKHLEKENEFLKNDIDFLLRTVFQYDSLSGTLFSVLNDLIKNKSFNSSEIMYLHTYLVDLSVKGFNDIEGFLKRDMQINRKNIDQFIKKLEDFENNVQLSNNSKSSFFTNIDDNNFM
ncbi:hypothetical protein CDIK_1433 [Cucumispora dikerogammari]|nr:hypothetical protein CDIK_1433 [Cucumispora dikerogammari]